MVWLEDMMMGIELFEVIKPMLLMNSSLRVSINMLSSMGIH